MCPKLNIIILKFMFVIVALKAQKRIAQGKAYHVGDGRAESAKAWITAGYLTLLRFGFYDNTDNRDNGLILNSMLSVDNNKNNFYQPKGWLPLVPTFTFVALAAGAVSFSGRRTVSLSFLRTVCGTGAGIPRLRSSC